MRIMREETFGPVLPIMVFDTLDEALRLANDSAFGLTASIWTRNRRTAERFADGLEAGTVSINDHMTSFPEPNAIWGGIKQTGIGRSHGRFGMQELVNVKYTWSDYAGHRSLLWWYPYSKRQQDLFLRAATLYHETNLGRRFKVVGGLVRRLPEIRLRVPLRNFLKSLPGLFIR